VKADGMKARAVLYLQLALIPSITSDDNSELGPSTSDDDGQKIRRLLLAGQDQERDALQKKSGALLYRRIMPLYRGTKRAVVVIIWRWAGKLRAQYC